MRAFTIVGLVLLVIGLALVWVWLQPHSGLGGEAEGMGAGIAALTLVPMGIIFTLVGLGFSRASNARKRLLRTGVPGTATILSVDGGSMVVNQINVLLTYELRVSVPGRVPYDVTHRQLTSMFQMASMQVGATVPVMVDPTDPKRLTIDLAGQGSTARQGAARQSRPISGQAPGGNGQAAGFATPNTLTSMGGAPGVGYPSAVGPSPSAMPGVSPETADLIVAQLARAGITVDPGMVAGGQVTLDGAALDLRPGIQETLLVTGRPGSAVIRRLSDTGVNVRGDSLVRLTLDVTPQGGLSYPVETGSLVPDAARARAVVGATVPVRIDPAQAANVVVAWTEP